MFKFQLPQWAAFDVQLPTGTVQRMIHVGNGEFVSELPPLVLDGDAPLNAGAENRSQLPVAWDSSIFGDRSAARRVVLVFDAPAAMAALQAAEASGDVAAISTMQRVKNGQAAMDGAVAQ